MICKLCGSEMLREQVSFMKCSNRKCTEHHFGIRMSDVKPVEGVGKYLVKGGK